MPYDPESRSPTFKYTGTVSPKTDMSNTFRKVTP